MCPSFKGRGLALPPGSEDAISCVKGRLELNKFFWEGASTSVFLEIFRNTNEQLNFLV